MIFTTKTAMKNMLIMKKKTVTTNKNRSRKNATDLNLWTVCGFC